MSIQNIIIMITVIFIFVGFYIKVYHLDLAQSGFDHTEEMSIDPSLEFQGNRVRIEPAG